MVKATAIDPKTWDGVKTTDVIAAVVQYPLICDIFAFDTIDQGIKTVAGHCSALAELIGREDALETLKKIPAKSVGKLLPETKAQNTKYIDLAKLIIKVIIEWFQTPHFGEEFVADNSFEPTYIPIYTPNGTPVTYSLVIGEKYSAEELAIINWTYILTYPNAEFLATATSRYNCHSFVWYGNGNWSFRNNAWIDGRDIPVYWQDGSYNEIFTPNRPLAHFTYNCADYVVVKNGNSNVHSFIRWDGVHSNNLNKWKYYSKWGEGPIMISTYQYSPYYEEFHGLAGYKLAGN